MADVITREAIIDEARSWLNTPWIHQACLKGLGCDCIGLIGGVAVALGIEGGQEWATTPRYHAYGRSPDAEMLREGCARFLDAIAPDEALPGDILTFSFEHDPQHFAIVSSLDPMRIIHAYAQRRRVVENGLPMAKAKLTGAFRYRGVI